MELVHVHMIRFKERQAGLQVLPEFLCVLGCGLGGDVDVVPDITHGIADLLLTVRVSPGCIKQRDAAVICLS